MITQAQAAQELRDLKVTLVKISGESSQTLQKVKDLQALLDAGGQNVSPELEAAINDVVTGVQNVDELVPDVTDGSGQPETGNDQPRVLGVDGNGIQTGVGPNGETGRKGPTAQL